MLIADVYVTEYEWRHTATKTSRMLDGGNLTSPEQEKQINTLLSTRNRQEGGRANKKFDSTSAQTQVTAQRTAFLITCCFPECGSSLWLCAMPSGCNSVSWPDSNWVVRMNGTEWTQPRVSWSYPFTTFNISTPSSGAEMTGIMGMNIHWIISTTITFNIATHSIKCSFGTWGAFYQSVRYIYSDR